RRRAADQKHIVEKQRAFPAHRVERVPPCSVGARQANRASAAPMAQTINTMMKKPRVGSDAKACTEDNTPERTRKVPIRLSENPPIASSKVQVRNAPLFSVASAEWSSAV